MEKLFLIIIFILSYTIADAQYSISGKVTDQDHQPLTGAVVYISELNRGTYTDDKGSYSLSSLPAGKLRIMFSFIGYASQISAIDLHGNNVEVNATLSQTAVEADEVVVSGIYNSTQHNSAVKIDVLKIDPHSIKITPNFAEVLTRTPGVDMISKGDGVGRPVIRGLSLNDILILSDGVRFENYQYSDHHPLGIDEFGVGDVEVIKGPASLLYGSDAIGGVINFIREKSASAGTLEGDYNLQFFSNSLGMTNNLGIRGAGKKISWGVRIGNKTNADYLQGGGDFVPNTRFRGTSLALNSGYSDSRMSLSLSYDYSSHKIGLAEEDAVDFLKGHGRGRDPEVYYMQVDNHLISSRNKIFLNKFRLEADGSFQRYSLIHSEGPGDIAIQMALQTTLWETRLYLPSGSKSEYIIGLQGLNQVNKNLNNRETKLLPDAITGNYSAFGLLQHTFFGKAKLQTGFRYDNKKVNTEATGLPSDTTYRPAMHSNYGSFSGSAGATYNATERLLLRANFAAAYRTPNLAELTSNGLHETRFEIGDKDLHPEKSREADLSLHYHETNFTFEVAGYYNLIRDYIFISPTGESTSSGAWIYKYMQADSYLYGGEADFHLHPKHLEWLHFETTFSTVTGKTKDGGFLPFIPARKLRIELRGEKEKLAFLHKAYVSLNATTAFAQNNPAIEESATEGYTIIDLGIGGNLKIGKEEFLFGVSANNLFDKKYVDHLSTIKEVGYFNPGRNITFSMKLPFRVENRSK